MFIAGISKLPSIPLPAIALAILSEFVVSFNVNSVIRQRGDLRLLEGTQVECSGRVKEFREHDKRRDLGTLLLVNMIVTPLPIGESILVNHLWFLRRQFKKVGRVPAQNERVRFRGEVYCYTRLGGKSIDRDLFGSTDYGIKPLSYVN